MAEHEKRNIPVYDKNSSSEKYYQYEEVIQRKIHPIFERFINPHNVLKVFWKYDQAVLVRRDIQLVEAVANNNGMAAGAAKLLELLSLYKNWLPCLMQVLRDNEVKQEHVAEMILHAIEGVKSDTEVDITVKALAEKEVLLDRLKTELEQERTRHAAKEKEMFEQKVLAEKNQQDQDLLIQRLKIELEETKKREKERCAAEETLIDRLLNDMEYPCVMELLLPCFAKCGQFNAMKELIKKGIDINMTDSDRTTPLMSAAGAGNLECVNWLLSHGADINMADIDDWTALSYAAVHGRSNCVQALLKAGGVEHVNISDKYGKTPLMLALTFEGDWVQCLQMFLNSGASVDVKDKNGYTPLLLAAKKGNVNCLQTILEAGGYKQVNTAKVDGQTALMLAARSDGDSALCLQKLLNAGADIYMKDKYGYTALAHAAEKGNFYCLQILLKAGGHKQVNISKTDGLTALMLAARSDGESFLCLQKLLNAGADIHMKDKYYYTALAHAAEKGNVECLQALLEAGSSVYVNVKVWFTQTPLMLAAGAKGDRVQCVQKLLNAGADTHVKDYKDHTALFFCVVNGNVRCKEALTLANTVDSFT